MVIKMRVASDAGGGWGPFCLNLSHLNPWRPLICLLACPICHQEEERQLMRFTRLGTWAFGLWSAKNRAEAFSADRLGFLAADGDLDAAPWIEMCRTWDGNRNPAACGNVTKEGWPC